MAFDIFGANGDNDKVMKNYKELDKYGKATKEDITIKASGFNKILASNQLFPREHTDWYNSISRFGYLDPYTSSTPNRQYLFFTKPDLDIFKVGEGASTSYNSLTLNDSLSLYPIFIEGANKYRKALTQLQYSVKGPNDTFNPFMYILSNGCTSKLDLPSITSESNDSTTNMYGSGISYRSHSIKSDNGYDFTLGFTDTIYTEIYMMVKLYDEYIRLLKMGKVDIRQSYITNKILQDQFSIYKFIIGEDGETIIHYSKLTGVYFTDVPRSDFSDPGQDGFKFSLSFHAQFVRDMNPVILKEFNSLVNYYLNKGNVNKTFENIYNYNLGVVNNKWCSFPYVEKVSDTSDKRLSGIKARGYGDYTYRLKFIE